MHSCGKQRLFELLRTVTRTISFNIEENHHHGLDEPRSAGVAPPTRSTPIGSGMFRAATLTASGVIRSVSEMLHDLARFRAVFLDVGVIARGRRQAIGRHAPQPFRGRQHGNRWSRLRKEAIRPLSQWIRPGWGPASPIWGAATSTPIAPTVALTDPVTIHTRGRVTPTVVYRILLGSARERQHIRV
jgi:hypothetical protein